MIFRLASAASVYALKTKSVTISEVELRYRSYIHVYQIDHVSIQVSRNCFYYILFPWFFFYIKLG